MNKQNRFLIETIREYNGKQLLSHATFDSLMSKRIMDKMKAGTNVIIRNNETHSIIYQGNDIQSYMRFVAQYHYWFEKEKIFSKSQQDLHYLADKAIYWLYDSMFDGFPDDRFAKAYEDMEKKYNNLLNDLYILYVLSYSLKENPLKKDQYGYDLIQEWLDKQNEH